jgi:hypothetical protein
MLQIVINDVPLGQVACRVGIKKVVDHFKSDVGNPYFVCQIVGFVYCSQGPELTLGTHGSIDLGRLMGLSHWWRQKWWKLLAIKSKFIKLGTGPSIELLDVGQ